MKTLLQVLTLLFIVSLSQANEADNHAPTTQTLVWPDGTRYVGGVVEGMRSGRGTIFWQDGTRFIGHFKNDLRNGPGTMILPDGTVYTGFFENDEIIEKEVERPTNLRIQTFNEAKTKESLALGNTELPIEADSLFGSPPPAITTQSNGYDSSPLAPTKKELIAAKASPETIEVADNSLQADAGENYKKSSLSTTKPVKDSVKKELVEVIDLWASAWSNQDVTQYLSFYSQDFEVPRKQSRRSWESIRRDRLTKPSYIILDISYENFQLLDNNTVEVSFQQTYRSNAYSDLTNKLLRMGREDLDWKILLERSR